MHERLGPAVAVLCDGRDGVVRDVVTDELRDRGAKLGPLLVGALVDLAPLTVALRLVVVALGDARRVRDRAHRDRFGEEGRERPNDHDPTAVRRRHET